MGAKACKEGVRMDGDSIGQPYVTNHAEYSLYKLARGMNLSGHVPVAYIYASHHIFIQMSTRYAAGARRGGTEGC